MTLTNDEINNLIRAPKTVESKSPASGYTEARGQRRCNLELRAISDDSAMEFSVFIRQNLTFIENFSIGLTCKTGIPELGEITLARYNGPHGEYSRDPDGHYARPHIHRITEDEIAKGQKAPKENDRQITDQYSTLDQALIVFFNDIGATDFDKHFPSATQMELPDGHC